MVDDRRTTIENALTVLAPALAAAPKTLRPTMSMAFDALQAAQAALDDLDEQLDVLTGPGRDAAAEVLALKKELQTAQRKIATLEEKLMDAEIERDVEKQVHDEEHQRLAALEKKAKTFDDVLLNDDAAFDRYMDQALEEHERKHGRPPKR